MTATYTYDGSALTTVERESVSLTEQANMNAIGTGSLVIADPSGALEIVGHKLVKVEQDDCSVVTSFRGYVTDREYGRGAVAERTGTERAIKLNLIDLNAKFGFKVIRGSTWENRPDDETIGDRLTDLLASGFLGLADNGFVDYSSLPLDGGDLEGLRPGDVIADMAEQAGFNTFAYWDEAAGEASLWFQDSNTSTDWSSSLKISDVIADVLADADTFYPSTDTALRRSPGRVVSGLWLPYQDDSVYRTRPATETTYEPRDGAAPNSRIRRRAKAEELADLYLETHKDEEDFIRTTIELPTSKQNLVRAGQRIEAKFTDFTPEGFGDWNWYRVLDRNLKPLSAEMVRVTLTLQKPLKSTAISGVGGGGGGGGGDIRGSGGGDGVGDGGAAGGVAAKMRAVALEANVFSAAAGPHIVDFDSFYNPNDGMGGLLGIPSSIGLSIYTNPDRTNVGAVRSYLTADTAGTWAIWVNASTPNAGQITFAHDQYIPNESWVIPLSGQTIFVQTFVVSLLIDETFSFTYSNDAAASSVDYMAVIITRLGNFQHPA